MHLLLSTLLGVAIMFGLPALAAAAAIAILHRFEQ